MPAPKLNAEFVVRIPIKNERGDIVAEKEFVTYPGLLALAHELGLEEIHATVLQMPTEANGQTAVVRAIAKGKPGVFSGLGDASPQNVGRKVARHVLRVAETRAKARALRDLCNVHQVALEELNEDDSTEAAPSRAPVRLVRSPPAQPPSTLSEAQRRTLLRAAHDLGHQDRDAAAFLARRLGVEVDRATRAQASRLIEALTDELAHAKGRGDVGR